MCVRIWRACQESSWQFYPQVFLEQFNNQTHKPARPSALQNSTSLCPASIKWIQHIRAACIFTMVSINMDLTLSLSSWQMWSWWMDWHWKEAPTLPTREREEKLRWVISNIQTAFPSKSAFKSVIPSNPQH